MSRNADVADSNNKVLDQSLVDDDKLSAADCLLLDGWCLFQAICIILCIGALFLLLD